MRLSYLPLIIALATTTTTAAVAQENNDPGASGVIDGSDVRQFLDSGARFSPTRMEEASRRFDKMIKMPPRVRKAKTWDEVIKRDNGLVNQSIPTRNTQAVTGAQNATTNAATAGSASAISNPGQINKTTSTQQPNEPKEKHRFIKSVGRGLEEAAEVVGFPIADEFLPNDVDASLAGGLPKGDDPRVYVHPKQTKKQIDAKNTLLEQAESRGASAEEVIPEGNGQAPALFSQE